MIDNKRIEFITNIGSYKPKFVIQRVLSISIASVALLFVALTLTGSPVPIDEMKLGRAMLMIILAFNSVSELNIALVKLLRKVNVLRNRIVPQALIIFLSTVFLSMLWVKAAERLFDESELLLQPAAQLSILFGTILVLIMHILIMMSSITREWMESLKEIDRLKNAKLQSDYSSLQDRLNPHFLFNNLSVLRSLIRFDAQAAETFTQHFTDVYRYVLRSHENKLLSLESELKFLGSYIALHKERLGDGFDVQFDIEPKALKRQLPPMAVQLLVENAIKHNVTSRHMPLVLFISTGGNYLMVKNTINKKETTYSTHTGLKTLESQYQLISGKGLIIKDDGVNYIVTIPLL